jgi:hypothetical protein
LAQPIQQASLGDERIDAANSNAYADRKFASFCAAAAGSSTVRKSTFMQLQGDHKVADKFGSIDR